jgi:hypothetical protein
MPAIRLTYQIMPMHLSFPELEEQNSHHHECLFFAGGARAQASLRVSEFASLPEMARFRDVL